MWYLGAIAWLHSPLDDPKVVPVPPQEQPKIVVPRGTDPIPVYGEAIPDASEYPAALPPREVVTLGYTIEPGQSYVLADPDFSTDYYYYTSTFDCQYAVDDCTVVSGSERYFWIWFGYRMAFVNADDVQVRSGMAR